MRSAEYTRAGFVNPLPRACRASPPKRDVDGQNSLGPGDMRGELRTNEPMSRHTTWRAGGSADRAYFPADLADLAEFLRALAPQEPIYWVGLGSNLLVRDGGIRGTVVFTHNALREMRLEPADKGAEGIRLTPRSSPLTLYAQAGVASPKVARFAALHDYEGAEFLAGIPGTVGGALAMNAGCYGTETWEIVEKVATLDRAGALRERTLADYDISYRTVVRREELGVRRGNPVGNAVTPHPSLLTLHTEEWFVAAWLRLRRGDGTSARERIKQLLTRRIGTQPLNLPNAGSVFRNPPGDFAARLIEGCALKGFRIGGATVSEKHANFIVNTGRATAADIESVIEAVRETVKRETGVALECEVRIIGEG